VFLKVKKTTINMLRMVEPYVAYGYPNLKSFRALIYKKVYGKLNKQRIPLANNKVIEEGIGKHNREAKLLFVFRIRGINAMHPKTKKDVATFTSEEDLQWRVPEGQQYHH
jgi:ribosomal protein L30/L7E